MSNNLYFVIYIKDDRKAEQGIRRGEYRGGFQNHGYFHVCGKRLGTTITDNCTNYGSDNGTNYGSEYGSGHQQAVFE